MRGQHKRLRTVRRQALLLAVSKVTVTLLQSSLISKRDLTISFKNKVSFVEDIHLKMEY
jgi:hypothetical protein